MDSYFYSLVVVPSLRELLPRSDIAATKGNILSGGLLLAVSLRMGLAFLWCPVGGKFGRVRTLMLTIVWYWATWRLEANLDSATYLPSA